MFLGISYFSCIFGHIWIFWGFLATSSPPGAPGPLSRQMRALLGGTGEESGKRRTEGVGKPAFPRYTNLIQKSILNRSPIGPMEKPLAPWTSAWSPLHFDKSSAPDLDSRFFEKIVFFDIFRCIFDVFWCWDGPWYSPDGPGDPWDQKKSKKYRFLYFSYKIQYFLIFHHFDTAGSHGTHLEL